MKLVQYKIKDNNLYINGTNQAPDLLISCLALPWRGFHVGCYIAAKKLYAEIRDEFNHEIPLNVGGYSMGGGIAQALAHFLIQDGVLPILSLKGSIKAAPKHRKYIGEARIYGNDPVPSLFPWFGVPCNIKQEGHTRRWWKITFKDHVRY